MKLLERCAQVSSVIVILIGSLVLVGWMFDISLFKSILPIWVTMKANTAIAFVGAGFSLWLLIREPVSRRRRCLAQFSAFAVTLIGLLTLGEYLFNRNLGIDQWLFRDLLPAVGISHPGRMALTVALNFLMIGVALLLLDVKTRQGYRPTQFFVLVSVLVSFFALIDYIYGTKSLYRVVSYTPIALHTAVAFLVLGFGILCVRADLLFILASDNRGGDMVRRLLPATIAVPLVMGWLKLWGQRAGFYDPDFGYVLFVLLNVIVLTLVIWWNAVSLNQMDAMRRRSEEARLFLSAIVESSDDAVIGETAEGVITSWNRGAERIYGYRAEEAIGKPISLLVPPERLNEITEVLKQVKQGKFVQTFETVRRRKDGKEIDISLTVSPIRDEQGQIIGASAIGRNITEFKQTQNELKTKVQELERLNRLMIGREERILELKEEIKQLKAQQTLKT